MCIRDSHRRVYSSFDIIDNISMDKHSLLMRTNAEQMKRKKLLRPTEQIIAAIKENRASELKEFFNVYHPSYVNTSDPNGDSLLMIASKNGNIDIVTILLTKGADPNLLNHNNETALHFALGFGHFAVADTLINAGIAQNVRNNQGKTAWDVMRR
eukprot:TRINITY_DN27727_c0_g1_i1.p1 TRINITY_DN27727_c0_g1~~TRINITY_DN27727_c0_g1_i1.p1  ORF type:complete len:168 (-),score=34.95 TRINITY_DN27727_c0_g1_i1:466-930(-)